MTKIKEVKQELEAAIHGVVEKFAERLQAAVVAELKGNGAPARAASKKVRSPRSASVMRCRHPGCKKRSKGPRFHYLCEGHLDDKVAKDNKRANKDKDKDKDTGNGEQVEA